MIHTARINPILFNPYPYSKDKDGNETIINKIDIDKLRKMTYEQLDWIEKHMQFKSTPAEAYPEIYATVGYMFNDESLLNPMVNSYLLECFKTSDNSYHKQEITHINEPHTKVVFESYKCVNNESHNEEYKEGYYILYFQIFENNYKIVDFAYLYSVKSDKCAIINISNLAPNL